MDLAAGHVKALEWGAAQRGYEVVNLGAGKSYTVLEVLDAFERAIGRAVRRKLQPRRAGDIAAYYADTTKTRRLLDWGAVRSIDDMALDAWRWGGQPTCAATKANNQLTEADNPRFQAR